MNVRNINIALLFTLSFGVVLSEPASFSVEPIVTFVTEIPSNVESFVKEDPKAAAAVIVALASVIIFRDVVASGVKRVVKMIKKNPIISIGSSVILAGLAYCCWDYYYNQESDMFENFLNSIDGGAQSLSSAVSVGCLHLKSKYQSFRNSCDNMTHESADGAREVLAGAKELAKNAKEAVSVNV